MKTYTLATIVGTALLSTLSAQAGPTLLVDRGLPVINLNNSAGADRSNVSWTEPVGSNGEHWVDGDSFTNTSTQSWRLSSIRVWAVEPNIATASLWGGVAGSTISLLPGAGSIANTSYVGGDGYQGYSGNYYGIQQIDFAVDITLAAGETFQFFLDGTGGTYPSPFSHASNAALSGAPQDSADGKLLWGTISNGSFAYGGDWSSAAWGWDKVSDINVQAFGTAVPEPASYALTGVALLALAVARRRVRAQPLQR